MLSTRLDAKTIAFIFDHAETKVVFVDREFSETVASALTLCQVSPLVVDIDDPTFEGGRLIGELTYEQLIGEGDPNSQWHMPADESGHQSELHIGYHRQPQRSGLPSPWGLLNSYEHGV